MNEYTHIELELPGEVKVMPYNARTEAIEVGNGIILNEKLFRISGFGDRSSDGGKRIYILNAQTPDSFYETAKKAKRLDCTTTFLVHDLDKILSEN